MRYDDRAAALAELADCAEVTDGWTVKSFTDRLFVVEVSPDGRLPADVRERLHERDPREADEVYGAEGAADTDYAGALEDGRRYRFVVARERGELQPYVVE